MIGSFSESEPTMKNKDKSFEGRPIKVKINPKDGKKVFTSVYYYLSLHSSDCMKIKISF